MIKYSLGVALYICSLNGIIQIDSTDIQTNIPQYLSHCSTTKAQNQPTPDSLQISPSIDIEVEKLLETWYEGYTRKGANSMDFQANLVTPDIHDSVYIKMLDRLPSALPLTYNSQVREGIDLYIHKRRSLLSAMLSLGDLYFPEIEVALDKHQLPLELKYLTVIESALRPSAVSPVGASGLWQIMLPTGRIYGLQINSLVDERFDPSKSTDAACRLLKDLYKIYNDWFLVMAAYNCGPGNVNKAIRRSGAKNPTFWSIYPYLPRETRRYVPLFIGAYFAMYYHKELKIERRELTQPLSTDYYTINYKTSFDRLAQVSGISKDIITIFNPQFRRGIVPGNIEPYALRLPLSATMRLAQAEATSSPEELRVQMTYKEEQGSILDNSSKAPKAKAKKYHIVRRGQTLSSIARQHRISVRQLKAWNKIRSNKVKVGQKLIVAQ